MAKKEATKSAKKADAKAVTPAMFDLIQRPLVTEKSTAAAEFNKVVFQVREDATKATIKDAVEAIFGVTVTKVNTLNNQGKTKRFRGQLGKRSDQKKAIVTLAEGQSIDLMAGVK